MSTTFTTTDAIQAFFIMPGALIMTFGGVFWFVVQNTITTGFFTVGAILFLSGLLLAVGAWAARKEMM